MRVNNWMMLVGKPWLLVILSANLINRGAPGRRVLLMSRTNLKERSLGAMHCVVRQPMCSMVCWVSLKDEGVTVFSNRAAHAGRESNEKTSAIVQLILLGN